MTPGTAAVVVEFDEARFLDALRTAVGSYFGAIDAWESAYRTQYRLVTPGQLSADLEPLHKRYLQARRELEELIPHATRLCRRYGLREPWNPVLVIQLGAKAPQSSSWTSAVGQGERTLVRKCLEEMESRIGDVRPVMDGPSVSLHLPRTGLLGRILNYFL